ncbi:hypothetical protein [Petroclostridium sp. X23]|uniref:hypothetical protein n=1 Tax=Petroclostridium sp. X23 TaxID=3045146 RepID=UPI0024ADF83C|nr:hypothetical protein [Petroclostridium sp. X23]WHH61077.1 hypothetical protein QKW49_10375 [Petroclostridium sp. X23]
MENTINQRIDLTLNLLNDLKSINEQLTYVFTQIEKSSDTFHESILNKYRNDIENDLKKYKTNIKTIKQLNLEITSKINTWYEFTKDDHEMKKLSFPIKFYFHQRKLKKDIKRINKQIYDITIENRFVKEQLINWERDIEIKALHELKLGTDYRTYEQLVQKKNNVISDLKYIIPTLPVTCPIKIDPDRVDTFIQQHLKAPA